MIRCYFQLIYNGQSYTSEIYGVTKDEYEKIKVKISNIDETGFEFIDKDGDFVVFPIEVVKKCVIKLIKEK